MKKARKLQTLIDARPYIARKPDKTYMFVDMLGREHHIYYDDAGYLRTTTGNQSELERATDKAIINTANYLTA